MTVREFMLWASPKLPKRTKPINAFRLLRNAAKRDGLTHLNQRLILLVDDELVDSSEYGAAGVESRIVLLTELADWYKEELEAMKVRG